MVAALYDISRVCLEDVYKRQYLAYVEAYSSRRIAYAEVDSLVVKPAGDSQKVPLKQPVGSLRAGSTMTQVALGNSGNAPRTTAVSYTHLDVYKRQGRGSPL